MMFPNNIMEWFKGGPLSLPALIAIVLSVAFIAMLLVTVFTLISMKRAELKAKRVVDLPPSAIRNEADKGNATIDENATNPLPIGEWLNQRLIKRGYIRVNSIVRSFFKALDFLKSTLGIGYKYKLPWYLMIGTEGSGKSSLLKGFSHEEIYDDEEGDAACTWWFLKSGVVLDIKGSVFLPKISLNADERSWNIILNMLSRYRGAKPINGLILTIPADELYGKNKLPSEEIKKRALFIARKLNFAQNYLGMKLPIYVVVTKTDIVPGFQSFCSEIPVRNRGNMLGWSSPYSVNTIFSARMLDEAFASIENELNEIRMEIFAESSVTTTRDGVFVFPSELLTIKESLSCYIDTIFKSSSVEERFYFRGFYFTGDSKMVPLLQFDRMDQGEEAMAIVGTPDADINEAGSTTASIMDGQFAPEKIFFFEDLLLKKIFVEDGLAAPMLSKIHQFNKSIFIAKVSTAAFIVIGSYGLFSAKDRLRQSKDTLYPSLFKISSLIKSVSDLTFKNLDNNGNEILADCTTHLLAMMQQINNARFSSLFVPASWFGSIDSDLKETLRASYQKVVVRTIYMNLLLKAKYLLNMKPDAKSTSIAETLNPANSKEYQALKEFVFGLVELEKNIKRFDSLRTSADPKDLNDLIDYTFHGSLPKEFLDNYQQFRKILMNTPFPPINLTPYRQVAYDVLISLFQSYLDTIFTSKAENSVVSMLNGFINQLARQQIKKVPDCSAMRQFAEDLQRVCGELGKEGKTWLDNEVFTPDEDFDQFLDGVETLFDKETAQKLLDITAVNFGYLKAKLTDFNVALQNDITQKKAKLEEAQKSVSSGIYLMEQCLTALCSEPFMDTPANYRLITDVPEGKMIFWDDDLVQRAYEIGQCFIKFSTSALKDFPRAMQEGILLMAKSNLGAVLTGLIAKSQSIVDSPVGMTSEITSEEILQKQVAELKGVAPKFVSLLKILRDDKFGFVFGNLRGVLNKVAYILLDHVDNLLEKQSPYSPPDLTFKYWDGEPGAGLLAFSAADVEELALYVKLQRSIIERLALDFAGTIVDFLNADVIHDPNFGDISLLRKWTRIVENARNLQKKNPSNSISSIERFIKVTLNEYTLDNITSKISAADIRGSSGDYFIGIMKEIKKDIMARAEVLLRKRNIERYNTLLNYYTKHLAGKYPFSDYDKTQRTANDADLEAVTEFFKMYDEFGGTPEAILDQIHQLGADAAAPYDFLKRIHEIRQFFGDSINNINEGIKISLEINFTINKREEANTEYLVVRALKTGADSKVEPISPDKTMTWYFGEPIEFTARFAVGDEQAPKPTYDQNDPDLSLNETTATVQCVGNWSLLRFLQKYRSETNSSDRTSQEQRLLCFKIPLSNSKTAKIYVAVTASSPRKPGDTSSTTIKIPGIPGKMSEMPEAVLAVKDEPVLVNKYEGGAQVISSDADQDGTRALSSVSRAKESSKKGKKVYTGGSASTESVKQDPQAEVKNILESPDEPPIKEEQSVIEIAEEPIE
ncbi:MAG: hypothetical protein LBF65_03640 [Holosporales bacterium]|jgi:type VI secretion system protein ImpL|nr:hypothetical protein [Holosporales bacterium]